MRRTLAVVLLVVGLAAATSPVWAQGPGNPSFSPDPASPGQRVTFSGSLPDVGFPSGTCDVTAPDASTPTYTCSYADSTFTGWVVIPSTAATESAYALVFCGPANECAFNKPQWRVTNSVAITSSPAAPISRGVVVPVLHCRDLAVGASLIQARGLVVAPTSFAGVIGRVSPSGGSTVSSGSTVTPYPPRVPDVVALPLDSASALVKKACGSPYASGTASLVGSQSPAAGTALPADRLVTLVLDETAASTPWWKNPVVWIIGILVVVVLVVLGLTRWAIRRARRTPRTPHPPEVVVTAGVVDRTNPPDPRSLEVPDPDLIVVRYPTTYWMEEPS